ncbi:isochorismatase family protein [Sphingosinicella terrae]|uniref:isochorismatase family protein n=1 Tax=Sphingosinicella terrae TaxID=2172047 RepID=UPI0025478228|nr:isochorismatase family protein [Sphingosinicella terrae]
MSAASNAIARTSGPDRIGTAEACARRHAAASEIPSGAESLYASDPPPALAGVRSERAWTSRPGLTITASRSTRSSRRGSPCGTQTLWPGHCVQGTAGADFHPVSRGGALDHAHLVIRKGYHPEIDSYSAFYENDRVTSTGLAGYLREKGVRRCVLVGLAFDFCVAYSALDAVREGFGAVVIRPLTRAIALPEGDVTTVDTAERRFAQAGIVLA